MNFINARTPATARTGGAGTGTAAAAGKGLVELTMYKEAPAGEVSVEEFEKYALYRLRGAPAAGLVRVWRRPRSTIDAVAFADALQC
jgi:hypothetical protein